MPTAAELVEEFNARAPQGRGTPVRFWPQGRGPGLQQVSTKLNGCAWVMKGNRIQGRPSAAVVFVEAATRAVPLECVDLLPSTADGQREQPLNVEVGKREADAMFHRRDRSELLRKQRQAVPADAPDEFGDWLDAYFSG